MSYEHGTWRLLITPPGSGAWNMAVDEALLSSVYQGSSPATLRLYAWEPACLSIGYAQPIRDVDLALLAERGWELVRRPTGGRAIMHTDELTYSVIAPNDEPRLLGGVLHSYQSISQALLHAMHSLGIPAQSSQEADLTGNSDPSGPVCFEVPSPYEIIAYGKKLIGSAQARKREGVLQHGSLPLYGDLARITQVLSYENERERNLAAARLLERAATVAQILGEGITWETASQAFVESFSLVLNLNLQPQGLSTLESVAAERLVAEKYSHPAWSKRV